MQPHDTPITSKTTLHAERMGLVSGRLVLLFSAIVLFLGVPIATWLTLRWVESTQPEWMALNYEQREQWRTGPLRVIDLTNTGFLQPPGSASYRNIRFAPDPKEVQSIQELRTTLYATDSPELAADHPIGPMLDDALDGTNFYSAFLLGQWLRHHDKPSHEALSHAFAHAPKAVVLRFITETGEPADALKLGTLTLVCARNTPQGDLDESLQLVYPNLVTDAQGRIYLPVYDAPLRFSQLPTTLATGKTLQWPEIVYTWFDFPGRVGLMNPVIVRNDSTE